MKSNPPSLRKRLIYVGGGAVLILAAGSAIAYLLLSNGRVYVDTATITAPLIALAPTTAGQLNALYVSEGDTVAANTPVAEVGTEIITTKVAGLIVNINDTLGAQITPGEAVVTMIDPTQLRVDGQVDENSGLSQIAVGDPVVFTADAFGSEKFYGVVDEVSPTSRTSDIVFSVSDQREEQEFDVKARFNTTTYPQLKNGMSARMWIYTTQ